MLIFYLISSMCMFEQNYPTFYQKQEVTEDLARNRCGLLITGGVLRNSYRCFICEHNYLPWKLMIFIAKFGINNETWPLIVALILNLTFYFLYARGTKWVWHKKEHLNLNSNFTYFTYWTQKVFALLLLPETDLYWEA